ncbi:MAG: Rieske (2Fe-2S) protein [Deltaproteobacteria bacterium]|nr:Rieske (2Fe-2S) protein [Deltaproteobacteria bacterium]
MSKAPHVREVAATAEGWLDLCPADVAPGELRAFDIDGRAILIALARGRLAAIDDQCNHSGCLLSSGWIDEQRAAVICPCHEISFELATGKNLTIPRLCDDQPTFPLKIEAGRVFIRLDGDPR